MHESLRTREQVIARCLRYNRNSKTRQFIGTAATTHDLIAMADTFDGPGSPIHFLGIYEGSVVGSHLLESAFPVLPLYFRDILAHTNLDLSVS